MLRCPARSTAARTVNFGPTVRILSIKCTYCIASSGETGEAREYNRLATDAYINQQLVAVHVVM